MKKLIAIVMLSIFVSSCRKEISINLNKVYPHFIIESEIVENSDSAWVKISKSVNFDQPNTFPFIENAIVTISDDMGQNEILPYCENGIYYSKTLVAEQGRTYHLNIKIDDEVFTSTTKMLNIVKADSIVCRPLPLMPGQNPETLESRYYFVIPIFRDIEGAKDFYCIRKVNEEGKTEIAIFDDTAIDGKINTAQYALVKADKEGKISCDFIKLEKSVYEFYLTLGQSSSAMMGTPSNPKSNISSGAIGYFSAYAKQSFEKQVFIPKEPEQEF